ncbi:Gfo/Idh/MocA family protein [Novosphingopyxis baekryungensis]|uniref:Gfo/Idh/MocA family protein n=1 Tax=Novosphingopyxis baekryungensis TaxID=279369 RepID=UPI0003B6FBB2|nr:Gfo/Idh/MocA family oxidoreductase [Novosphingopyxis baekryungensis]
MTLRVAMVGAAWGAMAHLPAWRALGDVEVTAICTSREETARAAAQRYGIERPFWDALAMCRDPDIDIIDLGTRPNLRVPWIIAALHAGKHLYNASPHAPDWSAAKSIDNAWRASQSIGVVDAFIEHVPAVRRQIELIEQGYIGTPIGGTCHFNISLFNAPAADFPYAWFADGKAGVSGLRNNGSHALYPLMKALGPIVDLVADDRQVLAEWPFADGSRIEPETNDTGNAMLRFASGALVQLQAGWAMPQHDGWLLDLYGSEGRLMSRSPTFPTARDCKLFGAKLQDKADQHAPTDLPEVEVPQAYFGGNRVGIDADFPVPPAFPMALSMRKMVDAIHGKASAAPDFGRALEVERVMEAMRLSSAERRWVAPGNID